jgi:glycyl-tRNA synthetase beta chain
VSDFLLELRSEEIPARMQAGARAELERLFRKEMDAAGVSLGDLILWSTPRRLTLIARDLPLATAAVREEVKGPRTSALPQALDGFLRKTGLTPDQLTDRDGVWFAMIERPGRAMAEVLAAAIPAIVRGFTWPKSMRWGAASTTSESLRWVRPLSGIVALLGGDVVPCTVEGIEAGRVTRGHRFHHSGDVTIADPASYAEVLRGAHVIVDQDERAAIIRDGAAKAAADAGLMLVADEGLVVENAGLTEWPVPLLGRFDEEFLDVPPEVIQLTARVNQKYFVCEDGQGKLANAFICTANIVPSDGGAGVVDGNRKVLAARLSDARFFWEQDQKKTLAQHAEKLANIIFHEKLGTVADKVERVAKLARWLVESDVIKPQTVRPEPAGLEEGVERRRPSLSSANGEEKDSPSTSSGQAGLGKAALADLAERAARLCKADLVTEMVGEFPELQGLMGGNYAAKEGLDPEVVAAIRDHYKPVGQGDEVPTAPVTVAVSLADKLDTIVSMIAIGETPSGSRDPFAIRRQTISTIALLLRSHLRLPLGSVLDLTANAIAKTIVGFRCDPLGGASLYVAAIEDGKAIILNENGKVIGWSNESGGNTGFSREMSNVVNEAHQIYTDVRAARSTVALFFADRLKVQQREAGVRHDLIDAVFALGGEDDLVRLLARVKALQAFMDTPDGANLLAGYKRAANLLKQAGATHASPSGEGPGVGSVGPASLQDDKPHPNPVAVQPTTPETEGLSEHDTTLLTALDAAEPAAAAAVAKERFSDAMTALASLRAPIDAFFEGVMVNDPDEKLRAFRLGLLARFTAAVHSVADFSRIEG